MISDKGERFKIRSLYIRESVLSYVIWTKALHCTRTLPASRHYAFKPNQNL